MMKEQWERMEEVRALLFAIEHLQYEYKSEPDIHRRLTSVAKRLMSEHLEMYEGSAIPRESTGQPDSEALRERCLALAVQYITIVCPNVGAHPESQAERFLKWIQQNNPN